MGKLFTDVLQAINLINATTDELLHHLNDFNDLYIKDYILREVKDPEILKEKMKEKIELGVRTYDSE